MLDQIEAGVEIAPGVALFLPAELVVVVERIDARRRHIGVRREIARDVEARVRVAAFLPADGLEVPERIDVRGGDIGVVLQVVDEVEAVGGDPRGRLDRLPLLAGADGEKMK